MPFFSSIAAECSFSLECSIIFSAIMSNQAKPVQQKQNAACFWLSVFLVLLKSSAKPNRTTTISSPTYRQNQLINCTYICVLGTEQTRQKIATCSSVHNAGKKRHTAILCMLFFSLFLASFSNFKVGSFGSLSTETWWGKEGISWLCKELRTWHLCRHVVLSSKVTPPRLQRTVAEIRHGSVFLSSARHVL